MILVELKDKDKVVFSGSMTDASAYLGKTIGFLSYYSKYKHKKMFDHVTKYDVYIDGVKIGKRKKQNTFDKLASVGDKFRTNGILYEITYVLKEKEEITYLLKEEEIDYAYMFTSKKQITIYALDRRIRRLK